MIIFLLAAAAGALQPAVQSAPAPPIGRFEMAYPWPAPDGRSLVFQGDFDGRWQLYAIELESGRVRRLHVSARDDTHPSVSPDGRRLAFISNRNGNDELYLLDLATGAARPVSPHPGKDGHPKWSPDGQWLVFNRTFDPADTGGDDDSAILRVRPDGSGLETISDTPRVETFASFSPDGRSIALVEWFPDEAGVRNRNGEIVVVDLATGARSNLTHSPAFDSHPFWGADGHVYFSTRVGTAEEETVAVHRVRPGGTGPERLTPLDGRHRVRAVPSADGSRLLFNVAANGRVEIHSMPLPPPGAGDAGAPGR